MHPGRGPSVVVRGQLFGEDRENGTPLQTNDTNQRQISARAQGDALQGSWQAAVYRSSQGYDQSFSAVAAGRASESLTSRQRVPADTVGGSANGSARFRAWSFSAARKRVTSRASTQETRIVNNIPQTPTFGGRRAADGGGLHAGDRSMRRRGFPSSAECASIIGRTRASSAATSQSLTPVSPRVAASFRAASDVTVRGTVYRAFRTPTLNELYRNFRAGDAQTLANESSRSGNPDGQRSRRCCGRPGATTVRGTLFFNSLDDAIANVTLTVTPTLTTRQRQNAGSVNARGFELEVERRLTSQLAVSGMLTMTRSRFGGGGKLLELEGLDVPQVPRYSGGVSLRYVEPRWVTATLQVRGDRPSVRRRSQHARNRQDRHRRLLRQPSARAERARVHGDRESVGRGNSGRTVAGADGRPATRGALRRARVLAVVLGLNRDQGSRPRSVGRPDDGRRRRRRLRRRRGSSSKLSCWPLGRERWHRIVQHRVPVTHDRRIIAINLQPGERFAEDAAVHHARAAYAPARRCPADAAGSR